MKKEDGTIKRHPLSFLVEAADSICYGIMDLEDGYNANWYTFDEMIYALNNNIYNRVIKKKDGRELLYPYLKNKRKPISFSIEKLIDFKREWDDGTKKDKRRLILDFRVALIRYLSKLVIEKFEDNLEDIDKGYYPRELLKDDDFEISGALSDFAQQKLISRREIQELELTGNSVINGLLDILMRYAFSDDKKYRSKVKAVISKSRMEVTLHESMHKDKIFKTFEEKELWDFDIEQLDNYSKLRLIVDFVASMTDKYSVELYQKLAGMRL